MNGDKAVVERARGLKCRRCWTVTWDLIPIKDGPLCLRCAKVVEENFPDRYILVEPAELYDAEHGIKS